MSDVYDVLRVCVKEKAAEPGPAPEVNYRHDRTWWCRTFHKRRIIIGYENSVPQVACWTCVMRGLVNVR